MENVAIFVDQGSSLQTIWIELVLSGKKKKLKSDWKENSQIELKRIELFALLRK